MYAMLPSFRGEFEVVVGDVESCLFGGLPRRQMLEVLYVRLGGRSLQVEAVED